MADLFQSSSRIQTAIWVARLVLLSLGIMSTFIFFKVAIIPYVFSILSSLPTLWISFRSLLSRPYIYFILNFIILAILAASSSAFHTQNYFPKTVNYKKPVDKPNNLLPDIVFEEHSMEEYSSEICKEDVPSLETCSDDSSVTVSEENHRKEKAMKEEEQKQSQRGWDVFDKNDVSTMPEDYEDEKSLDETWRMITEGQGKTREKQLKKSETWERWRKAGDEGRMSLIRRRETSITGAELKERVEAFIKRFNNDMRLQKQESDQRFIEMVSRGV